MVEKKCLARHAHGSRHLDDAGNDEPGEDVETEMYMIRGADRGHSGYGRDSAYLRGEPAGLSYMAKDSGGYMAKDPGGYMAKEPGGVYAVDSTGDMKHLAHVWDSEGDAHVHALLRCGTGQNKRSEKVRGLLFLVCACMCMVGLLLLHVHGIWSNVSCCNCELVKSRSEMDEL
jgi:hypothetical protein